MGFEMNDASADEVIARLGLEPHPEGGHYRETFRDTAADGGRGAVTVISYLLRAGERSAWHRIDAVEIWHFYAGAPLELLVAGESGRRAVILGADFAAGMAAHGVVPAFAWQSARSLGAWTLVGCTVAPAFEFQGFELAPAELFAD
jgi:predicted cupin superfamily sugar epimerase